MSDSTLKEPVSYTHLDVYKRQDEETGALTPEGNLTMVDDYHTSYSDGSGQQFIIFPNLSNLKSTYIAIVFSECKAKCKTLRL